MHSMKWRVVTICDYGPPFLVGNDFFVPGCELENGLCRFEYLLGEWKGNNRAMKEAVYKKKKQTTWTIGEWEARVSGMKHKSQVRSTSLRNAYVEPPNHVKCCCDCGITPTMCKTVLYACVDWCSIWRCSLELRKLKAGEHWKAIVSSAIPVLVETAEVLW